MSDAIDTDGDPLTDLTSFQRDLLVAVNRLEHGTDRQHGLAIKAELEQYYDNEVHHGRLYPNLDSLVDKGLVEKEAVDGRTNTYALTGRGTRELAADRKWRQ